jgi:DNA-binding NarL/FixJ family response regulator
VRGYLLNETSHTELRRAIRTVHAGRKRMQLERQVHNVESIARLALTPRVIEDFQLLEKRKWRTSEIARELGTAAGAVKMQVQNILTLLFTTDRTHAVTIPIQRRAIRL